MAVPVVAVRWEIVLEVAGVAVQDPVLLLVLARALQSGIRIDKQVDPYVVVLLQGLEDLEILEALLHYDGEVPVSLA